MNFSNSEYVNFYPFIGEEYFSAPHKILVLGESHYGPDSNNSYHEWTIEVVRDFYLDCKKSGASIPVWTRCHDNTARTLADSNDSDSYKVYESLAFYNFFQRTVGEGNHHAKDKVTPELISLSRKALKEVLKKLEPDLVVAWGYGDLEWHWLPQEKRNIFEGDNNLHLFTINEYPSVPFWCMKHPSSFFSIDEHRAWFQHVKNFLGW